MKLAIFALFLTLCVGMAYSQWGGYGWGGYRPYYGGYGGYGYGGYRPYGYGGYGYGGYRPYFGYGRKFSTLSLS